MRNIIENISLKKLSWLAALPVSLAAFSASIVPAQANEHHQDSYSYHNTDYSYCSRWEYRHDYHCKGYYQTQYDDSYSHNEHHYDKWDYRYHKEDHHDSYHSDWKR